MLDIYTVAFIGHRYIDRFSFVEDKVEELVRELIGSKSYVDFLVGRDGDFDQIVSSAVLRVKKRVFDANSSLIWVMPYETAEYRDKRDREARRLQTDHFMRELKKQESIITEFDEILWYTLIDRITVYNETGIRFTFKDGTEYKV